MNLNLKAKHQTGVRKIIDKAGEGNLKTFCFMQLFCFKIDEDRRLREPTKGNLYTNCYEDLLKSTNIRNKIRNMLQMFKADKNTIHNVPNNDQYSVG